MNLAIDTTSTTFNFAKENLEDSVVESPSSQGAFRTPICKVVN
jgi:hypothetical protein